jgi:hypothetical protein
VYATSDSGFGQLFGTVTVELQYADTQSGPWTTVGTTTGADANNNVVTVEATTNVGTKNCWRVHVINVGNYGKMVEMRLYELISGTSDY